MDAPLGISCFNILYQISILRVERPGKIGKFDMKNEEKASLGVNKIGRGLGSRNTFMR